MNKNQALLLIDVQQGFHDSYWGQRNNPQAEENIKKLLSAFRQRKLPVFHAQHLSRYSYSPLHPNKPGVELMEFARPIKGEQLFQKNVNSAFIGTNLEKVLKSSSIQTLIIVGISTDHCVSTTTRMSANLGFENIVIADATFTFDRKGFDGVNYSAEKVHHLALASLHQEFAIVMNTDEYLASHAAVG